MNVDVDPQRQRRRIRLGVAEGEFIAFCRLSDSGLACIGIECLRYSQCWGDYRPDQKGYFELDIATITIAPALITQCPNCHYALNARGECPNCGYSSHKAEHYTYASDEEHGEEEMKNEP